MKTNGPPFAVAVLLIALAGFVDAVGYLQFGRLFVSFMSGTTTKLGLDLGQGDWRAAAYAAIVVVLFVIGSFAGTLMAAAAGRWRVPAILTLEGLLLGIALPLEAPAGQFSTEVVPIVLAMGMQNITLQRVGHMGVSLTYVTGTLVKVGQNLGEALLGRAAERWLWLRYLMLWVGLITGAVCGAASFLRFGLPVLVVPAIVALALAGAHVAFRWQSEDGA